MNIRTKIVLVFASIAFCWMIITLSLAFYMMRHPGPVPRTISVPLMALLIVTILGGSVLVTRLAKRQTMGETVEEARIRRARAIKGMKLGLVVWGLIFLNGVRLVAQHEIAWMYAIPGLAIDSALILVFWTSLKRLKKFEARPAESPGEHRS